MGNWAWHCALAGLLNQGVLEVPRHPLAPPCGPLGSSPDRQSAIGNTPALVPGPKWLGCETSVELLTELSPQGWQCNSAAQLNTSRTDSSQLELAWPRSGPLDGQHWQVHTGGDGAVGQPAGGEVRKHFCSSHSSPPSRMYVMLLASDPSICRAGRQL